jgi:hypothetical protein
MMWLMMLASIVLLAAVADISAQNSQRPSASFFEGITAVATLAVIARVMLRRRYVGEAVRLLAQDPTNAQALRRWQASHIIGYALSESVALFGINLRYLGFTFREVVPFYIAGFVLMLFSAPKAIPKNGLAS